AAALALALVPSGWDIRHHRARLAAAAISGVALVALALHIAPKPIALRTSIASTASAAFPGDEVDFTVGVVNRTSEYLPHATLMIQLPQGMRLLGPPAHERGRGCKGSTTLSCDLDFLEGHMETKVHLGVRVERDAGSRLVVSAWGLGGDVVEPKASFTVITGSA